LKHNATPQDVEQLSFDRLTFVFGERDGKKSKPINPEATIVAVKGAVVPSDANASVGDMIASAVKAGLKAVGIGKKDDDETDDRIEQAVENSIRSAMYDAVWSFQCDLGCIVDAPYVDDQAKKDAIDKVCADFGLVMARFAGELLSEKCVSIDTAQKAGARHNKKDAADVKTAHANVGKALDALKKAHDATSRLQEPNDDGKPVQGGKDGGKDSAGNSVDGGKAAVNDSDVYDMTKEELQALVAGEVEKAVKAAAPAAPAPDPKDAITEDSVKAAIKAAVDEAKVEFKTQIDAANKAASDAKAEAATAKDELEKAVKSARDRQAPGGHTTALEGAAKGEADDRTAAQKIEAAKPKTITEAVAVLCK
jgi:hypothetical protein